MNKTIHILGFGNNSRAGGRLSSGGQLSVLSPEQGALENNMESKHIQGQRGQSRTKGSEKVELMQIKRGRLAEVLCAIRLIVMCFYVM